MADIARLGLAVDSDQVKVGIITLHQLTGAAGQASAAAQRLAGASQAEASGQKVATAATQAHTAALAANNAVMRQGYQVRTNMIYQLNDVGVSLASGMNPIMVAVQQLPQMLQFGLKPAIDSILGLAKGLVTTFWPVAAVVGAVSLAVAGLTHEINETAAVQVGFFDVALAGWQLFAEGVAALVAPVFGAIGGWLQQGWDAAVPVLKGAGNAIIGTFVGAVAAVKASWSSLPPALGDVMIITANNVILAVQKMINGVGDMINGFLAPYNAGLEAMGQKAIPTVGKASFGALENPYQGAFNSLGGDASAAFSGAQRDYMGDAFGALSGRAQEIAAARKEVEDLGGAAKAANDNVKKLADDGLSAAAKAAKEFGDTIKGAFKGFISDLREGKSWTEALGNALGNLGDRFLDLALDAVFGGAGGGGIFGALAGIFGFANGGVFNAGQQVQAFAKGGVVSKPTMFPMANGAGLMGEAGPEAIMPLRRGADGRLGVSAANQNQAPSQPQAVHVTVGVAADGNGNILPFVQSVSQQTVASAAPSIVGAARSGAAKDAPTAVARFQQQRGGSDFRTM